MQYFLAMIHYFRYFFSIRREQEDYTSNYAFYAFLLALFFNSVIRFFYWCSYVNMSMSIISVWISSSGQVSSLSSKRVNPYRAFINYKRAQCISVSLALLHHVACHGQTYSECLIDFRVIFSGLVLESRQDRFELWRALTTEQLPGTSIQQRTQYRFHFVYCFIVQQCNISGMKNSLRSNIANFHKWNLILYAVWREIVNIGIESSNRPISVIWLLSSTDARKYDFYVYLWQWKRNNLTWGTLLHIYCERIFPQKFSWCNNDMKLFIESLFLYSPVIVFAKNSFDIKYCFMLITLYFLLIYTERTILLRDLKFFWIQIWKYFVEPSK